MSDKNKALIRRIREEILPSNDLSQLDALYTDDYVWHRTLQGDARGPAAYRQACAEFLAGIPDCREKVMDQIAEGDMVVTRFVGSGTHTGFLYGIPGTGREIKWTGIMITRFSDGKIAEEWVEGDSFAFMRQLGASLQMPRVPEQVA